MVLTEDGDAEGVFAYVVCNKVGLGEDLAESFAQRIRGRFFEVSAPNGDRIGELFGDITRQIANVGSAS
jgi:hypothetical protein